MERWYLYLSRFGMRQLLSQNSGEAESYCLRCQSTWLCGHWPLWDCSLGIISTWRNETRIRGNIGKHEDWVLSTGLHLPWVLTQVLTDRRLVWVCLLAFYLHTPIATSVHLNSQVVTILSLWRLKGMEWKAVFLYRTILCTMLFGCCVVCFLLHL